MKNVQRRNNHFFFITTLIWFFFRCVFYSWRYLLLFSCSFFFFACYHIIIEYGKDNFRFVHVNLVWLYDEYWASPWFQTSFLIPGKCSWDIYMKEYWFCGCVCVFFSIFLSLPCVNKAYCQNIMFICKTKLDTREFNWIILFVLWLAGADWWTCITVQSLVWLVNVELFNTVDLMFLVVFEVYDHVWIFLIKWNWKEFIYFWFYFVCKLWLWHVLLGEMWTRLLNRIIVYVWQVNVIVL